MKVLVLTDLCKGYSITLSERNLYKELVKRSVKITLITHWPTPESAELENSGIKTIYLPVLRKIDLKAINELRRIIIKEESDILYITYGKALTNSFLAARGLKVKIIGYIGSLNVHWHDPTAYFSFLNPRINKIVCLSNAVKENFVKQLRAGYRNKCRVIYKGYDPEWITVSRKLSRESLNIPEEAMIICCIAEVRRIKGIPYLIKAAGILPEEIPVYFIMIGKGMDSKRISRYIRKTGFQDKFRIFGFMSDVFPFIDLCDVYVQPSITEGLGRSIIEAMCLRKPVIVTDSGGTRDLAENEVNGFIVPVKSPEAIAEKIIWCFENRNILPEMGEKSLIKVKESLNPGRMVEQTYKLFEEVLQEQ
ncbi:MAG: glycosyltransferase family 4 protein [Bacteroidales bacterium]